MSTLLTAAALWIGKHFVDHAAEKTPGMLLECARDVQKRIARHCGQVPKGDDLLKASKLACREAACVLSFGLGTRLDPQLPLFPHLAKLRAEGRLFQKSLLASYANPEADWIKTFCRLATSPDFSPSLHDALVFDESEVSQLAASQDDAWDRAIHQKLVAWSSRQIQNPGSPLAQPPWFHEILLQGWPTEDGRPMTFARAWHGFFMEQLYSNERLFRIFVIESLLTLRLRNPPLANVRPESLRPPHNLPDLGTAGFFGRDDEFAKLDQSLSKPDQPTAITSIHGMGGVGKSELGLRYARARLAAYSGGIFWAKVRDADLPLQILSFAQTCLDLVPPDSLQDAPSRVAYCWSHWPGGDTPVLLVLDDVTDWKSLQDYLPKSERFRRLITTRHQFTGVQSITLDVIQPPADLELLASLAGQERCAAQAAEARRLCDWLGSLPLALELVGRYLAGKPDLPLAEMRSRLEHKSLSHPALQPSAGPSNAQRSIEAAIALSWDDLSEPARELTCLLSLFALAPIPWLLVLDCFPDRGGEELEDLRDTFLVHASLLQRRGDNTFQLHQLIREFCQNKLKQLPSTDRLIKTFVECLMRKANQVPHQPTLSDQSWALPLMPHFIELAKKHTSALSEEDFPGPFVAVQQLHGVRCLFDQAELWAKTFVQAAKARFGTEHPVVANGFNNLATLLIATNRLTEAEPLMREALRISQSTLGLNNPIVAIHLSNLAQILKSTSFYQEAEGLLRDALRINQATLHNEHPHVATSLNNLARVLQETNRLKEAEPLFEEALRINRAAFGSEHPNIASSLNNLASLLEATNRPKEAETLLRDALRIDRAAFDSNHPRIAIRLSNLASLLHEAHHLEEAESLIREALRIDQVAYGLNHPLVAIRLNNLATLLRKINQHSGAEPLIRDALKINHDTFGQRHPRVAASLNNLAGLLRETGRLKEAENMARRALDIQQEVFGHDHPEVATPLNNLAQILQDNNRLAEAEPLMCRVLGILFDFTRSTEHFHPNLGGAIEDFVAFLQKMGRTEAQIRATLHELAPDFFPSAGGTAGQ